MKKTTVQPKLITATMKAPTRGRRPIMDKKRPIRVWLTASQIEKLGGEEAIIITLQMFIKSIL